jgi:hypothetical protein
MLFESAERGLFARRERWPPHPFLGTSTYCIGVNTIFFTRNYGTSDAAKGRSGFRSWFRILKSFYAKRTGRGGRGLEVCRLRPVGHAFGLRAAAAWPRVSVSGRSSAGPADVAVTGYGKICVS